MTRWLLVASAVLLAGCTAKHAQDGYLVVQAPIAGKVLSCRSQSCCWPWSDDLRTSACVRVEGSHLNGQSGVLFYVRGSVP